MALLQAAAFVALALCAVAPAAHAQAACPSNVACPPTDTYYYCTAGYFAGACQPACLPKWSAAQCTSYCIKRGSVSAPRPTLPYTPTGVVVPSGVGPIARDGQLFSASQNPNPKVAASWVPLATTPKIAVHLVNVPGTNRFMYIDRSTGPIWAGTMDIAAPNPASTWIQVSSGRDKLYCAGHTVTSEGKVLIIGGHKTEGGSSPHGMNKIREFDFKSNPRGFANPANMSESRWYPTPTLLANGKVFILGGVQKPASTAESDRTRNMELWDPAKPTTTPKVFPVNSGYLKSVKTNYYPFDYQLPTGEMLNMCNNQMRVIRPETGTYVDTRGPSRPGKGRSGGGDMLSQYPFTGTSVMLALRPENGYKQVEVMVFGGNTHPEGDKAIRYSHRMKITWSKSGSSWAYSYSPYEQEDMGIPRVMGDATLLPNGDVVLLNGAQVGIAGGRISRGVPIARYPAVWPLLYQPDAPAGKRYTVLKASTIPRLYHSTAALTPQGRILVAGCDSCKQTPSNTPFKLTWPATSGYEYRSEIFYPPYALDYKNKPVIRQVQSDTSNSQVTRVRYGQTITVKYANHASNKGSRVPVTSASIVAASATTHSFNINQRVIFLKVVSSNKYTGTVTLQLPPTTCVAPPQLYMLFIMNGKTYSDARWIKLEDTGKMGLNCPA